MALRWKKEKLSHGPSYNRLHGAPPSSVKSSTSSPEIASRHRVRFDDRIYKHQTENDHGDGTQLSGKSYAPSQDFPQGKVDLETALRHYGLKDTTTLEQGYSSNWSAPSAHYSPNSEHNQRLASFAVSLTGGLTNALLAYPCVVLRRQCQINHIGRKYHLTPFTLFGVGLNMQQAQGITCLWKGVGSSLLVNAIHVGTEYAASEFSSGKIPREIASNLTSQSVVWCLAMKGLTAAVVAPFYSVHLVESVQSTWGLRSSCIGVIGSRFRLGKFPEYLVHQSEMTSETPGIFSCLTEGVCRLFGIGSLQSPRLISFAYFIVPTVCHALLRQFITTMLQQLILYLMRQQRRRDHELRMARLQPRTPDFEQISSPRSTFVVGEEPCSSSTCATPDAEPPKSLLNMYYPDLISGFLAELVADVVLYPIETVIHRLHVQGTRTIIDNTDIGRGFLAVNSKYDGFCDCLSSTIAHEGYSGLYRGLGALMMQYSFKYAVLRLTKFALKMASAEY